MPDIDAIRAYYDHVDGEEYESLFDLFAEDIVYDRPGHAPLIGKDAFEDFYLNHRAITDGSHTVDEIFVDGLTVIVRGHFEGLLSGEKVEFGFADIHRCAEDDSIEHRWTFTDLGTV